jgi:hypothetical protein
MQRDNGPKHQDDFSDRKTAVAIGIGCKKGCSSEAIAALVERAICGSVLRGCASGAFHARGQEKRGGASRVRQKRLACRSSFSKAKFCGKPLYAPPRTRQE